MSYDQAADFGEVAVVVACAEVYDLVKTSTCKVSKQRPFCLVHKYPPCITCGTCNPCVQQLPAIAFDARAAPRLPADVQKPIHCQQTTRQRTAARTGKAGLAGPDCQHAVQMAQGDGEDPAARATFCTQRHCQQAGLPTQRGGNTGGSASWIGSARLGLHPFVAQCDAPCSTAPHYLPSSTYFYQLLANPCAKSPSVVLNLPNVVTKAGVAVCRYQPWCSQVLTHGSALTLMTSSCRMLALATHPTATRPKGLQRSCHCRTLNTGQIHRRKAPGVRH